MREKARDARPLDQRRPVTGWRFRAHRFGGRQTRRAAHSAKDAERRRARANQQGEREGGVIEPESEIRKTEKPMVHPHQLMTQQDSGKSAQDSAACHHHQRELQVMNDNLPIRKPKRFEDGDLFAL